VWRISEVIFMKTYRGIVQGKTIILRRKPDLPDGTEALVTLRTLNTNDLREVIKQQLEFLEKAPEAGKVLIKRREEIYER
jgi:hypothetical protein